MNKRQLEIIARTLEEMYLRLKEISEMFYKELNQTGGKNNG